EKQFDGMSNEYKRIPFMISLFTVNFQDHNEYIKLIKLVLNHPKCNINGIVYDDMPAIYHFIQHIDVLYSHVLSEFTELLDEFIERLDFNRVYRNRPLLKTLFRLLGKITFIISEHPIIESASQYVINKVIDKGI